MNGMSKVYLNISNVSGGHDYKIKCWNQGTYVAKFSFLNIKIDEQNKLSEEFLLGEKFLVQVKSFIIKGSEEL